MLLWLLTIPSLSRDAFTWQQTLSHYAMVGAICKLWLTVMMQSAVMMLQCLGPLCLQHAVVKSALSTLHWHCLIE